ncbi:hypothetical protein CXF59_07045 [Flavobacterium sp. ALD4]|uniref:glycosyltransferase n=1 Tax=Flavobacterium sp. ALD4 TaxID=2058314 RepID=UPI000C326B7A|nr:glycosyltransferase [Flavobacterium sp. ALD4]PKH67657.1 hypothetical protein CXF59_07045 [Flavobacterium sp. ALD4]
MKLLVNTTTLSGSGVTQVAVSFLRECIEFKDNEYHVLLGKAVESQIDKSTFPDNFVFYPISSHPLYGIQGFKVRNIVKNIERLIQPDCVFSIFGPSWWTPKKPHLMGYAYPHYVYPDSPLFEKLNTAQRLKVSLMKMVHIFFLRTNGKYYVSETLDVTNRLKPLLGNDKNFFTVTNTYNTCFSNFFPSDEFILPSKEAGEFRFLSLCTFAIHKNLIILNQVIPLLNSIIPNNKIKFVLTIDDVLFENNFNEESKASIINIGRIDVVKCPQLYYECDALFLPTTLECFSANYPEAMKMRRPIITSNLTFATSVCEDAALYFNPFDQKEIVNVIVQLVSNKQLANELVLHGEKRLNSFLTPKQRTMEYLKICKSIIEDDK